MSNRKQSRLALWVSGIYLALGLASFVLPLIAKSGDNLSAIYLILLAQPWATLLSMITDQMQVDSMALNMAALLAGVLLNTWIIYKVISWLSRRRK